MIETSCDLYITIQSEDLFDVVKKYSIKKKGDGNIVYYPDSNVFCFLVEYFNQANLYDAVPAYEWDLTSNILKWINDIIADNFLQQILLAPEKFDVVALTNLNGDYASDALAAQVGGIGISPGANINYQTGHAIFEATHGTAPDIAGQNKANPSSVLLSACMMLEFMGWNEAAEKIIVALEQAILHQQVTIDFASALGVESLSTSQFAEALIARI